MISGVVVDIVEIQRIYILYDKFKDALPRKILSLEELTIFYKTSNRIGYIAKRFAAKEAVSKALGLGIGLIGFRNIEILNDDFGKPFVKLHHHKLNFSSIAISISDERNYVVAFAIIEQ